jgi:hypothetical protein
VDRIFAHHTPTPAGRHEIVARDHLANAARQRHQYLHHPRLKLLFLAAHAELQQRRPHLRRSECEITFPRQFNQNWPDRGIHQ